jgi:hypothetical protein
MSPLLRITNQYSRIKPMKIESIWRSFCNRCRMKVIMGKKSKLFKRQRECHWWSKNLSHLNHYHLSLVKMWTNLSFLKLDWKSFLRYNINHSISLRSRQGLGLMFLGIRTCKYNLKWSSRQWESRITASTFRWIIDYLTRTWFQSTLSQ